MSRCVCQLTAVVIGLGAILSYPAYRWAEGWSGITKLGVAGGICWVTALVSGWAFQRSLSHSPEWQLAAVVGGMLFRMAVCLGAVLAYRLVWASRDTQFAAWMIVFYLVTLGFETTWFSRRLNLSHSEQADN